VVKILCLKGVILDSGEFMN